MQSPKILLSIIRIVHTLGTVTVTVLPQIPNPITKFANMSQWTLATPEASTTQNLPFYAF